MFKWLKEMETESQALGEDQLFHPEEEVESEDNVVGVAPDNLVRLRAISIRYLEDHQGLDDQLTELDEDDPRRAELEATAAELYTKAKLIRDFFWMELRKMFGIWNKDFVGVRKGWKVVWQEPGPDVCGLCGGDHQTPFSEDISILGLDSLEDLQG